MKSNRLITALLTIGYVLFSYVSFVCGIVLSAFYDCSPHAGEVIIRLIIAICWYTMVIFLMLRIEHFGLKFLLLIPPVCLCILHCAGLIYIVKEPIGTVLKNDGMLYPAMEFCFGGILIAVLVMMMILRFVHVKCLRKKCQAIY
jgi:hypothetical protein